MALRNIVKQGDEILSKKCRPVTVFDEKLHTLLDDMAETMLASNGVGLAASQVGILRRICVVMDTLNEDKIIELINPEIIETSGEQDGLEGCLSFPGLYGYVKRPDTVTVRAQDRNGSFFEYTGHDLTARAFCHETEHLDGHVFTERVSEYVDVEDLEQ